MARSVFHFAFALFLVLLPSRGFATPIIVDFESFSEGDSLTTGIPGLMFSGATVVTAGISLNEFEAPPHSGTNALFGDVGELSVSFEAPVESVGGFFTYSAPLTLSAFDGSHGFLGSVVSGFSTNAALSGDPGSVPNEFLQLAFPGIASLTIDVFDPTNNLFVLDDLTYTPTAQPIPEPQTLTLLALGLFGVARTLKRGDGAVDKSDGLN